MALKVIHAPNERINVIQKCYPNVSCFNELLCEICLLAKQRKLSFLTHVQSTTIPFQLIHTDIWGPYETPTLLEQRFFLDLLKRNKYEVQALFHLLMYMCKNNLICKLNA